MPFSSLFPFIQLHNTFSRIIVYFFFYFLFFSIANLEESWFNVELDRHWTLFLLCWLLKYWVELWKCQWHQNHQNKVWNQRDLDSTTPKLLIRLPLQQHRLLSSFLKHRLMVRAHLHLLQLGVSRRIIFIQKLCLWIPKEPKKMWPWQSGFVLWSECCFLKFIYHCCDCVLHIPVVLNEVYVLNSPREIRQGEEIAWYADGETIVRNEYNPSIAYAYGMICKTDIYDLWIGFLLFTFIHLVLWVKYL